MYRIDITSMTKKELDKLSVQDFKRLDKAILTLAENPRQQGVKKLKGPIHRLRVGKWRVIYAIFDKDQLIIIGKVAKRTEDTYDGIEDLF